MMENEPTVKKFVVIACYCVIDEVGKWNQNEYISGMRVAFAMLNIRTTSVIPAGQALRYCTAKTLAFRE